MIADDPSPVHSLYFKSIINALPQMVWSTLPDGHHDYYNLQWYQFTGVPEGSTNGEAWNDMFHPDDQDKAWQLWRQSLETGEPYEIHYRLRHHTGQYRWVLGRALPVRGTRGDIVRWMGTCTDIHEQKLAEAQCQRNAERMSLAIESAGAGVFEYERRTATITWDARMKQLFGVAPDFIPSLEHLAQLPHPDDRDVFEAMIATLLAGEETTVESEIRVMRPDGRTKWIQIYGSTSQGPEDSAPTIIGMAMDVTQSREQEEQLSYQATHDALTGLVNRSEFTRRLEEALRLTKSDRQDHVVCFIDLDHFKFINDNFGHAVGDVVLHEVANAMRLQIRASDVLARIGGDEFGLLLTSCTLDQAQVVASAITDALDNLSFDWDSHEHALGASIGMAALKDDGFDVDEVLSQADIACYAAKHGGRNRVSVYKPESGDAESHHRLIRTAGSIRAAIEKDLFCLFAQPIVAVRDAAEQGAHYELLLRMLNEDGELILPQDFIPAAERYGLMPLVDRWVIKQVFVNNASAIARIPGLSVAINLSGASLGDPKFLPFVEALMGRSLLSPERVHFEITETSAIKHMELALKTITRLSDLGCAVALDDFGSGLSSYRYIKHFPLDYLKIDGLFISNMKDSATDLTIVQSMHDIAKGFGLKTVAEFVENDETLAIVKKLGSDYAQGYGMGRPKPLEEMFADHSPRR